MELKFKKLKTLNRLTIKGAMTIYSAEKIKDEVFSEVEIFEKPLAVDLSAVSEIDTAGMQILLMIKKNMGEGCDFNINKVNDTVMSVINILRLKKQLNIEAGYS